VKKRQRAEFDLMKDIARRRNGQCISERYENSLTKLIWRCQHGHEWEMSPTHAKHRGYWCPYCSGKRHTIETFQTIARERGGECLSNRYRGNKTPLRWRCENGHEWKARPNNIKDAGQWCPKCSRRERGIKSRLGIEEMQAIARERGGECLSTEYTGIKENLVWRCSNGHTWEASAQGVRTGGTWCSDCAGVKPLTLEQCQKDAIERGGKCLSKKYTNVETKLQWRCENGHEWKATPHSIRGGGWCPKCGIGRRSDLARLGIEEMQRIASERGGECLSKTYKNLNFRLRWRCALGHEWDGSPAPIRSGTWCPVCSSQIGERIARAYLVQIFGSEFPRARFDWLINARGNRMELDGYSHEKKIAFEHHGIQHYKWNKHFFKSESEFKRRRRDDRKKVGLCASHGIRVIVIPEIPSITPIEKIGEVIYNECKRLGVQINKSVVGRECDLGEVYRTPESIERWEGMSRHADSKGGKLLSDIYRGSKYKHRWQCSYGHEWEATNGSILSQGNWCPKCARQITGQANRLSIDVLSQAAETQGGSLLSSSYVDSKSALEWRCGYGHVWRASATNIRSGAWCPICRRQLRRQQERENQLDALRTLAKNRGGECLAEEYLRSNSKLPWRCAEGHEWRAVPSNVKQGAWCPACAGCLPSKIGRFRDIAASYGGECLSKQYENLRSRLRFKCARGHVWTTQAQNVAGGAWCPKCFDLKRRGSGRTLTLEHIQELARARGGSCLSTEYHRNSDELRWRCSAGHQWSDTTHGVKYKGRWCPVCNSLASDIRTS